jgi:hypothetical protein
MSPRSGFADSDPASQTDDQPTVQYPVNGLEDGQTTNLSATEPLVAPPPDLEASGNAPAALTTAASSDRCSNCGAQLAPDQHYCVVCGERRGRTRFAGAMFSSSAPAAAAPELVVPVSGRARVSRYPPGTTLIAGILTLLVAMGLGILIGHDSSTKSPVASKQPVNVTVNAGSGLGTASGTGTTGVVGSSPSSTSTPSSSSSNSASKAATKAPSAAAQAKGTQAAVTKGAQAAQTVLGGGSVKTAAPTVTQGGACTPGSAGCTNGKFTGSFFGG